MIDWFILLAPILLLPIALLLFFVGCSATIGGERETVDVKFYITFYVDPIRHREKHNILFKIFDQADSLDTISTDQLKVLQEGEFGKASRVQHTFSLLLEPGRPTFFCQVFDLTATEPMQAGELLVDKGTAASASCEDDIEIGTSYYVLFEAGVSDDGVEPDTEFKFCSLSAT